MKLGELRYKSPSVLFSEYDFFPKMVVQLIIQEKLCSEDQVLYYFLKLPVFNHYTGSSKSQVNYLTLPCWVLLNYLIDIRYQISVPTLACYENIGLAGIYYDFYWLIISRIYQSCQLYYNMSHRTLDQDTDIIISAPYYRYYYLCPILQILLSLPHITDILSLLHITDIIISAPYNRYYYLGPILQILSSLPHITDIIISAPY